MKKVIMAIAALVAGMAMLTARADTWTDPATGITWTYTVTGAKVTIGTGRWGTPAIPKSTTGAIAIPATINGCPVTSIGECAFYCCSGLTSVTIPDGVTSIGEYAFYDCSGLTSVTIPGSVTSIGGCAFYCCSGLTSVTISNGVTSIGNYAFSSCSGLTSVTIPDSVTSIGNYAFSGCRGLLSIVVDEGNANYSSVNGLLLSKDGKTLNIGVNGDVTIPHGVTRIGRNAFYGCSGLTSVTIPDSVTDIEDSAFAQSGLTSVTIPNSVTKIGNYVFNYSASLMSIIVDEGNVNYKSVNGLLLSKDGKTLVYGANGDIAIPNGVTCIRECAFNGCSGLTSVTIPNSVTDIGSCAFKNSGLTSVTIPDSVTNIGNIVFEGCYNLTSVMIGKGVTNIGYRLFDSSYNLAEVIIDDDNTTYTSINSVIYDKNLTKLICCPETVQCLTLPKTVSSPVEGSSLPQGLKCLTIDSSQRIVNGVPWALSELYITDTEWNMPNMGEWDFTNVSSDLMIFVDSESRANRTWLGFTLHMTPSWYSRTDNRVKFSLWSGILTISNEYGEVGGVVGRSDSNSTLEDTSVLSHVYEIVIADGIESIEDGAFSDF